MKTLIILLLMCGSVMADTAFARIIIENVDGQDTSRQELRFESSPDVIAAVRAFTGNEAWTELPEPPAFDSTQERLEWNGEWVKTALTQAQKDAKLAEVQVLRQILYPTLSRRQLKLELLSMGILTQVETLIVNSTPELKIWWVDTVEFHRDHALVGQFAQQLGVSSEALDVIWVNALKR